MRFLKRILVALFIYIGTFGAAVLIANFAGIMIQDSLVAGICGSAALELIVGAVMKIMELNSEIDKVKAHETELNNDYKR